LSKNVNSFSPDLKPILAPNGRTLYFVRKFDPNNTGGIRDEQDIYYSEFINGRWTEAQNIGAPLNDRLANGIVSISTDGNTVWVINGYNKDGSAEHGISVSHKVMGAWTGPLKLNIQDFYNLNVYQDYSMSVDNKTLLMAIEREDSYGQLDFYVSFNEDSIWTAPMNLGSFINTSGIEYAPFLSPDTKTLYFSSEGYNKNGNSDIYFCKRLDDTWLNWTTPENVGSEINTDGWDSYLTMSPNNKNAYFVSSSGEKTSSLMASTDANIYKIPLDLEPLKELIIVFTGSIFDKNTKVPIEAKMYFTLKTTSDLSEPPISSTLINGGFNLNLEPGSDYEIKIESQGYFDVVSHVDLTGHSENEIIKQDFEMIPIKVGETFKIDNLNFVQGKAEILPESKPVLNDLIKI
ncbi:MAG: PD40 domain-containing protein, partial [Cyclobacteriaceae bacterium]|nr:PD40 domain-containing protein [Cyclobacteriaceae bacterium]